jgi:hypothetical protein
VLSETKIGLESLKGDRKLKRLVERARRVGMKVENLSAKSHPGFRKSRNVGHPAQRTLLYIFGLKEAE